MARLASFLFTLIFLVCLSGHALAYTETFYLRANGNGSAPETPAGAFDAADFNTAGNWDTDDADDGKIGPNDRVVVLDDDGVIRSLLTIQQSGLSGKPITIQGESGVNPIISAGTDITTAGWADQGGNVWRYAIGAVDPDTILFDGSKIGVEDATPDSKYEWTWTNPNLDVYATDDPDNGVYYTSIEAGTRASAIAASGKNYIIIDDVTVQGPSNTANKGLIDWATGAATGITVTNCTFKYGFERGLSFENSGNDKSLTITNNTFTDAGRDEPLYTSAYTAQVFSITVTGNAFTASEYDGTSATDSNAMWGMFIFGAETATISGNTVSFPLVISNTVSSIHIENNNVGVTAITISDNTITGGSHGIKVGKSDGTNLVEKNLIIDTYDDCLWITDSNGTQVSYNICDGNGDDAISFDAATSGTIFNNVLSRSCDVGIVVGTASNYSIKNNIVYENGQVCDPSTDNEDGYAIVIRNTALTGADINYNLYYHTGEHSETPYSWSGTAYSWANWKTTSSQDADSPAPADPLFTVVGSDFTLQAGSPAINAGVDVGLLADYGGRQVPRNGLVDIGAYEFWASASIARASGVVAHKTVAYSPFVWIP